MSISILVADTGSEFLLRFAGAEPPVFQLARNAFVQLVPGDLRQYEENAKYWAVESAARENLERFLAGAKAWLMAEVKTVEPGDIKRRTNGNAGGFGVLFESGAPSLF